MHQCGGERGTESADKLFLSQTLPRLSHWTSWPPRRTGTRGVEQIRAATSSLFANYIYWGLCRRISIANVFQLIGNTLKSPGLHKLICADPQCMLLSALITSKCVIWSTRYANAPRRPPCDQSNTLSSLDMLYPPLTNHNIPFQLSMTKKCTNFVMHAIDRFQTQSKILQLFSISLWNNLENTLLQTHTITDVIISKSEEMERW